MASKRILVTYNNSETLLRCFSPNDDCCPLKNKTIGYGDHRRLFFFIKFHTSNWNSFWIIEGWEIIDVLWIINVNIFIWNDFWIIKDLRSSNHFLHQISYYIIFSSSFLGNTASFTTLDLDFNSCISSSTHLLELSLWAFRALSLRVEKFQWLSLRGSRPHPQPPFAWQKFKTTFFCSS